jgi:hypothetical protein
MALNPKRRRCDARCHGAARGKCSCWCGGLFHGARGEVARAAFVAAYGHPIPVHSPELTEPLLHWRETESQFMASIEVAIEAYNAAAELDLVDDGVAA